MQIQPVRRYGVPSYATKEILQQHPELLKLVPERWQHNPAVLSALAALCMLMVGSRAVAATDQNGDKKKTPPASAVAPIFEHGNGYGAFGCSAVNPPVFLSEDEARQAIIEEAKKAGIEFKLNGPKLSKLEIPITDGNLPPREPDPKAVPEPKTKEGTLDLDGTDKRHRISFEFVSDMDFKDWEKDHDAITMVQIQDVKGTAKALRNGIEKAKPKGVYGVFYDPGIGWDDLKTRKPDLYKEIYKDWSGDWQVRVKQFEDGAREVAKEDLREQVKDFVKWLKAQGVI